VSDVPEEVRSLAAERDERRRAKDFAAADALRDRIAELGFTVIDSPEGAGLEPIAAPEPEAPARVAPDQVRSVLEDPATHDATLQWVVEGWPEDVTRAIGAFRSTQGERLLQYVVADVTGLDADVFGEDVEVVPLIEGTGWAAARNAGLKRSRGRIVLVLDGSLEPTGDVIGPLDAALRDPSVGVVGPFGIVTSDLQNFDSSEGPEVDAIEGYLMAMRRETLLDVGLFDEKFRWYRTADIEYSFRVKDAGKRAIVVPVPVRRHEHRMWFNTPPAERAKWSKRNYYRFLDSFRGRFDLLVGKGTEG
jgi:glycosyltransferase involved in cell wall biosynthesis